MAATLERDGIGMLEQWRRPLGSKPGPRTLRARGLQAPSAKTGHTHTRSRHAANHVCSSHRAAHLPHIHDGACILGILDRDHGRRENARRAFDLGQILVLLRMLFPSRFCTFEYNTIQPSLGLSTKKSRSCDGTKPHPKAEFAISCLFG